MKRAILLWTGATILSIFTIGIMNFLWVQGFAALIPEPRPLSPDNADTLQYFLNWFFPAFNAVLLFIALMYFHNKKRNLGDLAALCAVLVFLHYLMLSASVVPHPAVGLWYPFLPSVPFFQF